MRPFTVLIGIVVGSAASISFRLTAVSIVLAPLTGWHWALPRASGPLASGLGASAILTVDAAGSFAGRPGHGPADRRDAALAAVLIDGRRA